MKIRRKVTCESKYAAMVVGSFAPDGANAPTALLGAGFSVVWTSTGLFTVTFQEKYFSLMSATATLQLATADDKFIQVGTYTAPTSTTAATLVLSVWDVSGAALTDVAANANNRVNFSVVFSDTSVTR